MSDITTMETTVLVEPLATGVIVSIPGIVVGVSNQNIFSQQRLMVFTRPNALIVTHSARQTVCHH